MSDVALRGDGRIVDTRHWRATWTFAVLSAIPCMRVTAKVDPLSDNQRLGEHWMEKMIIVLVLTLLTILDDGDRGRRVVVISPDQDVEPVVVLPLTTPEDPFSITVSVTARNLVTGYPAIFPVVERTSDRGDVVRFVWGRKELVVSLSALPGAAGRTMSEVVCGNWRNPAIRIVIQQVQRHFLTQDEPYAPPPFWWPNFVGYSSQFTGSSASSATSLARPQTAWSHE